MTFEDFIIALTIEAPNLPDNGLRLLLHLVARSIESGSHTVTLSDRDIAAAVHIGHGRMGAAKASIAHLVGLDVAPGRATTFRLPQTWFPLQASLFSTVGGPRLGPLVTPERGHWRPRNGATGDPGTGSTDPRTGPQRPQNGARVTPERGQLTPERGQSDPRTGPRLTQNQQDSGAPSNIDIDSKVSVEEREYVFSILSTRHLLDSLRPSALALAGELQHFMAMYGNHDTAQKPPDDRVLAQCLKIAPVRELLQVLPKAKERNGKPKVYAWFVSIFLCDLKGIPREHTKLLREEWTAMRQAKPPARADTLPFPADLVDQAVNQVKRLR